MIMETLATRYDLPSSKRIVTELECTIEEIRAYAAAEVFDMAEILAVRRRLMGICEDLAILRGATGHDNDNSPCSADPREGCSTYRGGMVPRGGIQQV